MADSEDARPSRRRAAKKSARSGAAPSAVHYLGYVEDEESVEMIMKKFEALERIKTSSKQPASEEGANASACSADVAAVATEETDKPASGNQEGKLTEDEMLELFKETSQFTVRSALSGNDMFNIDDNDDIQINSEDDIMSDYEVDDDDDDGFWGDEEGGRKKRKGGVSRGPRDGTDTRAKMASILCQRGSQVHVTKRAREYDPYSILRMKMPPPPFSDSWGHNIQPYRPREVVAAEPEDSLYREEQSILQAPLQKLGTFLAVLMKPPFDSEFSGKRAGDNTVTVEMLKKLDLPKIVPLGFIFIWIDKTVLEEVMNLMYKWNYVYVENLTWVQMLTNNKFLQSESKYVSQSHQTLYIFRRAISGKDPIELRHQRSPDVVLSYVQSVTDGRRTEEVPQVYKTIETLLPLSQQNFKKGDHGQFLELWAGKDSKRAGWTKVHEIC
ncbi:hypothetical protein CYMTET_14222 [Cymbomonas tetramitiformis]|uniref:Uncharacterized protein n=1 Tax=Cymbomonas tetramitiformis TaxID=36881 RepID=A0AAE0GGS3_9CHLO|nr:hypothetical protein CYMTET_14222 [Cymbomonas tetramitiformis]